MVAMSYATLHSLDLIEDLSVRLPLFAFHSPTYEHRVLFCDVMLIGIITTAIDARTSAFGPIVESLRTRQASWLKMVYS